jgi:hypothetical protein
MAWKGGWDRGAISAAWYFKDGPRLSQEEHYELSGL